VRTFAYAVAVVLLLPILLVIDSYCIVLDVRPLARKAPDRTPVMDARLRDPRTPRPLRHRFVPLQAISPHLVHAVIVHEDATFYQHRGYDRFEIRAALARSWRERRLIRGASTLTNQLARNLYLGNDRTPLRKLREIPLTFRLEKALDKRRIMELYLNFAEWGPGVFGAEAAARYHFGHSAENLSPAEAALLAAALPSPRRSTPAHPTPYLRRRAAIILARMRARGWLTPDGQAIGRAALGLQGRPAELPETPLDPEPEPPGTESPASPATPPPDSAPAVTPTDVNPAELGPSEFAPGEFVPEDSSGTDSPPDPADELVPLGPPESELPSPSDEPSSSDEPTEPESSQPPGDETAPPVEQLPAGP
jgi:monofunctional biosynthetic peptidoglycan transglycosylase